MSIIITKNGKQAQKVDKGTFGDEGYLQQYIFDNPESLPLYEIKEDIRLLILAREFDTGSGPIDALGVDKEGEVYLIETKFFKNTDKRFVVAQVLDYAAALWRHGTQQGVIDALEESVRKAFGVSLRSRLQEYFGITAEEVEMLVANLSSNFGSGNFRFVVLMDRLHDRLKDLILFLNANSRFTIFAVEMEYYKFDAYEIVIPKLYGAEVKKEVSVGSSGLRRKWDEKSFFDDATKKLDPAGLGAIKKLFFFVQSRADKISWGTGSTDASFNPKFFRFSAKSPFTVYSSGYLQLNIEWLNDGDEALRFRERWREMLKRNLGYDIGNGVSHRTLEAGEWVPRVEEIMKMVEGLLTSKSDILITSRNSSSQE